ncbi:MAG: hypothetical protein NT028_07285 [candidate division Zixibacteria bacterium]|nr:hypothetical protein [candidate division Zixibacteria bacterium]
MKHGGVEILGLEVLGPVEIPFTRQTKGLGKRIDDGKRATFWNHYLAVTCKDKQGCYVFALRSGKGFTPYYVGKAGKKSGGRLGGEVFADHKLRKYNSVLFEGSKGTPVIFFVVPPGSKKIVPNKILGEVEKYLIQAAKYENDQLVNVQHTKNLPKWGIVGVIRGGQGKPAATSMKFSKMMGIS